MSPFRNPELRIINSGSGRDSGVYQGNYQHTLFGSLGILFIFAKVS
jgi:hypothetical protein